MCISYSQYGCGCQIQCGDKTYPGSCLPSGELIHGQLAQHRTSCESPCPRSYAFGRDGVPRYQGALCEYTRRRVFPYPCPFHVRQEHNWGICKFSGSCASDDYDFSPNMSDYPIPAIREKVTRRISDWRNHREQVREEREALERTGFVKGRWIDLDEPIHDDPPPKPETPLARFRRLFTF